MSNQRANNSYVKLQGDFLPRARFLHQACKISRILVKNSKRFEICSKSVFEIFRSSSLHCVRL